MKYLIILIVSISVAVLSGCSSTGKGGVGSLSNADTIENRPDQTQEMFGNVLVKTSSPAPGAHKGVANSRGGYALGGAGSSQTGNALDFGNSGVGMTQAHR